MDSVTGLHEFVRPSEIAQPLGADRQTVEQDRLTRLVAELAKDGEALLPKSPGGVVFARDVGRATVRAERVGRTIGGTEAASGRSNSAANQRSPSPGSWMAQNRSSDVASSRPNDAAPVSTAQASAPRKLS